MTSLRFKLWLTLAFMLAIIAVPGVVASHTLQVVQAQHARSEASAQSLSSFQRLAVLGYTLIQERYVDPAAFKTDQNLYLNGIRSHVTNAERYINAEIRLIGETSLQRQQRARQIENELHQRDQVRKIGASLERAIRGADDSEWETLALDLIKVEEREAKEMRRSSIGTVKVVTDAMKLTLAIATVFGLAMVVWVQRQVIRPLGNLWAGTRAMGEGRYDEPVPVQGTTEFRTISASFNTMAGKVGDAARTLQRDNEELERAVNQRTAELAATNRSLEKANRLRQQFLADASHELRTPLSIMRSEAEITLREREADTANMRTSLERIVRLSASMGELIEDMLQIARAEEPMLQTSIRPVDVVTAVHDSVDDFRRLIEADGGRIAVVETPESLVIEGDESKLQQVIRIVLDNAVCYSSHEPVVDVAILEEQGDAVIRISDKGDGISAEDIPHLFKRFRRGSRKVGSGQGLGLSIARSISETLGGSIGIESKLHEGTTVSIRLPLLPEHAGMDGMKR